MWAFKTRQIGKYQHIFIHVNRKNMRPAEDYFYKKITYLYLQISCKRTTFKLGDKLLRFSACDKI